MNVFRRQKSYKRSAFTIVELLVVIVVIGILAAITIVSYTGVSQKAIASSLQSDLSNASKILKLDIVSNMIYPTSINDANGGKGIPTSSGVTYNYIANNAISPPGFCMTATKNNVTYRVTSDSAPVLGDCLDYGLILNLDAGNSNSYPGSGTLWTDLSGNGNNGTLLNGVGYTSTNGGMLSFDGYDDRVNTSLSRDGSGRTWELWVSNSKTTELTRIFGASAANQELRFNVDKSVLLFLGTSNFRYWNATNKTQDGILHHWVVTIPGTGINDILSATAYVDGSPLTITPSGTVNSAAQIAFSKFTLSAGYSPLGYYASVKVYNRALSSTEITQNYNATKARYGL